MFSNFPRQKNIVSPDSRKYFFLCIMILTFPDRFTYATDLYGLASLFWLYFLISLIFSVFFFSINWKLRFLSNYTICRHAEWRLAHQAWPLVDLIPSLKRCGRKGQADLYVTRSRSLVLGHLFRPLFPTVFHILGRI